MQNKPRHYLVIIPIGKDGSEYATVISRQYSPELAQRDACMRLEQAKIRFGTKVYIRELALDEDGVIQLVKAEGKVLPLDKFHF